ncbi:unnamed protein product [Owenia fusiformis]|uniref:Uncharacterized protein n=1 Tax=Owenia fusiformis TaxID=6347 RepID=A0A8S4NVH3_OWEFU|nr:unnamed protein product [Owenia fusiformis]
MDHNGLFDVQPLPTYLQLISGGGDIATIGIIATDSEQHVIREAGDIDETNAIATDVGHLDGHNIEVEREAEITETIYSHLIDSLTNTDISDDIQTVVMETDNGASINNGISPRRSHSQPEHAHAAASMSLPNQLHKVNSDMNMNTVDSMDTDLCSFFSPDYISDEDIYTGTHSVEKITIDPFISENPTAAQSVSFNDDPQPTVISLDKPVMYSSNPRRAMENNLLRAHESNSVDSMDDNYFFVDCRDSGTPLITPVSSSSDSSLGQRASLSDIIIEEYCDKQELKSKTSENEHIGTNSNKAQLLENKPQTSSTKIDIGNADEQHDENIIKDNDKTTTDGPKHQTCDIVENVNDDRRTERHAKLEHDSDNIREQIELAYQKGKQDAFIELQKTLKFNELLVNELLSEKHEADDYVERREEEALKVIDKLQREILLLRKQNTKLLDDSKGSCKGKYNKVVTNELIKIKYKSDKELAVNIGLRNKINELRLLVIKQQRHLSDLELTNLQLKSSLTENLRSRDANGVSPTGEFEMNTLSNMSDIIFCDKSKYIPQYPDDPALASCAVFNIGGNSNKADTFTLPTRQFNPLDIPYIRKQLSSDFQLDSSWQFESYSDSNLE